MSRFLSPTLEAVTPYTPGEQPQDQQYIKLNTNESPYLPSPAVVGAVSEAEVEKLRLYSDPACAELLRAAAAHFELQPEQIMPGNGSDENLFFALRAFCDENHPLAYADITYGCYGVWCGLMHIPSHIIPLKEDFTLDPADYYGLNETIVIANPNAPTGLALPRSAIEEILKSNPNHVVIVDEAYVDFGGESCVPLINNYENLLVVQTFSKSRQLAGARLGLAMGNAKLIADLNRVKFSLNPYNINRLTLNLDGAGRYQVDTGCGFLNHMLELFARHGRFDLVLTCHGDVEVDYHHTTEDVGIALGQAFAQALGDMRGIHRYGSFYLPMDEALILCAVDISGRCTLNWDIHCSTEKVGDFDVECAKEFWLGFARSVPATVHFVQFAGENSHHILEAAFKGAGRALADAVRIDAAHRDEIPSTKGLLV